MFMRKNLKGLTAVMLMLFCVNIIGYSQSIILNKKGDTLFVLTLDQSKFLIKECSKVEMLELTNEVNEKQLGLLRNIIEEKENVITKKETLYKNEKLLLDECLQDKSSIEHNIIELKEQVKTQKVQKTVIITLSLILLTLTTLKL
jgi:hypothetical protein